MSFNSLVTALVTVKVVGNSSQCFLDAAFHYHVVVHQRMGSPVLRLDTLEVVSHRNHRAEDTKRTVHPRALGSRALVGCTRDVHLLVPDTFEPKDTPLGVRHAIIRRLHSPFDELHIQDQGNLLLFQQSF